jgi:hypothetical protein
MKRLVVPMAVILCLIMASPLMSQVKKTAVKPKADSCRACHPDFSPVLPKGHKPVTGSTITACIGCHKPDISEKTEPKPFSARLHKPHVKPDLAIECTMCHTWVPGKHFAVKGMKANLGKVSKTEMTLMKKTFASWANSSHLDAIHGKAGFACLACHGKSLPEEGDTVENDRCLSCHGGLEALATRSAPADFPNRNPHKSHLGDIACTVCHHAHKTSTVYCIGCHSKFTMKIPAGE